ncbi:hypothetical protein EJK48_2020 [Moraxella catarrhalis]|uniref:Uncharacterized protein n=1 Tax=Moraxella catarrhalis TaxID=480 RepID=A0A3Q9GIN0_MORCA|nr:hypothetical protein MCR_1861 [Moraxella catarrhalis BBH18]AZQ94005.1 hypothetical protein EJK53_2184 [Moraxella catarrhalis]AZQ94774.1 hypothetical protein EJK48_2020 [Moraxella catarrhalis]RUO14028.1 hypothetical protein EJK49_1146 [Moraxella catarrhalis]
MQTKDDTMFINRITKHLATITMWASAWGGCQVKWIFHTFLIKKFTLILSHGIKIDIKNLPKY